MKLNFQNSKPIIGVVHLKALLGSPSYDSLERVVERAKEDARKLAKGGVDGLIIENFGDVPFQRSVGKMTVSAMTEVISEVKEMIEQPIGINVLRNDWKAALSITKVLDLDFVRINAYTGVTLTSEGIIDGKADQIQRFKNNHDIEAEIMADIQVKHAEKLYPKDIESEALEASERGLADALIISGKRTGEPPAKSDLRAVREIVEIPTIIGSGLDRDNLRELLPEADGAIIGSHLKEGGVTSNKVSLERTKEFTNTVKDL